MSVVTWNELSQAEQQNYLDQAYYLIEKGYVTQDAESIARRIYESKVNADSDS